MDRFLDSTIRPPPQDNVLCKALNICTVPALVAVEIAADPITASNIEALVASNLNKIKDGQLSKQSESESFHDCETLPIKLDKDEEVATMFFDDPEDSLESELRSYNANIHIEETRTGPTDCNYSPKLTGPADTEPLIDLSTKVTTGGTHFENTAHDTIDTSIDTLITDNSPIISILNELDEILNKYVNSDSTNPSITNLDLAVETQGDAEAKHLLININSGENSSVEEDHESMKDIPGRKECVNSAFASNIVEIDSFSGRLWFANI